MNSGSTLAHGRTGDRLHRSDRPNMWSAHNRWERRRAKPSPPDRFTTDWISLRTWEDDGGSPGST
jgi:hypothetical protein